MKTDHRYRVQVHQSGETFIDKVIDAGSSERAMVWGRDQALLPSAQIDPTKPYEIEVSRRFRVVPTTFTKLETTEVTS